MKEYAKLFEGKPASLNQIRQENPLLTHTVDILIKKGKAHGQHTLGFGEERDIVILPTKKIGMIPILIKEGVYRS